MGRLLFVLRVWCTGAGLSRWPERLRPWQVCVITWALAVAGGLSGMAAGWLGGGRFNPAAVSGVLLFWPAGFAVGAPVLIATRMRGGRAVAVLLTLGAALVLLVFVVVAHVRAGAGQVVGSPTRAQVTGTWGGDYGLGLVLRPDGTFSADLPAQVGTAAPVPSGGDGDVVDGWPAHGTWTIGPADPGGGADGVIFTVDCAAAAAGCAGHPRTFELQLETSAPDGGGGPALFYYLGGTRDLSSQYPFVRVP